MTAGIIFFCIMFPWEILFTRRVLDWLCLLKWHPHLIFAGRRKHGDAEQLRRDARTDVRVRALLDRNLRAGIVWPEDDHAGTRYEG